MIHIRNETRQEKKRLLDLLRLHLDSLIVHEYTLTLIRFRFSPLSDLRRELIDYLLLRTFEQYSRRLRNGSFDSLWYRHFDRMRITKLQRDELLSRIFGLFSYC